PEVIVPEVNQKNNGELVVGGDEVSEPVVPEPVTPEPVVPEPDDNNNQGFEPIVPSLVENVDVKVYPVPSNGPVNVELGSLLDETGSVQMILVNASGRVIITKTVYDDTIHLDLSHRAGVYILRLSTPSKTVVKRIIIQ
ncbi:MAG: T9SS type A sorting domain-containing protein, partial [Bacteroidales bacterium]|nr:T9SS type A sorting domain-containing protein [Bacteroidales bacterium]